MEAAETAGLDVFCVLTKNKFPPTGESRLTADSKTVVLNRDRGVVALTTVWFGKDDGSEYIRRTYLEVISEPERRKSSVLPMGRRCIWRIRAIILCNCRSGIYERLEALRIRWTSNFESATKEMSNLSGRSVQWAWSVRVDLCKINPEIREKAKPSR